MRRKVLALPIAFVFLAACQTESSSDVAPTTLVRSTAGQKIVQINYPFSAPRADFDRANMPSAKPIADVPGLRWKVWLVNEQTGEAGGIYLFDSDAAARAFINGPMIAELRSEAPTVSIKSFDIMGEHTAITRGPVN